MKFKQFYLLTTNKNLYLASLEVCRECEEYHGRAVYPDVGVLEAGNENIVRDNA